MEQITHTIPPVYDGRSELLLLGTMPSPKSREMGFYYGNRQNRMWPVLAAVYGTEIPADAEGRKAFLLRHHIAMWDVLKSCEITGADDASIRSPVPNDLRPMLRAAPIRRIFTTGTRAFSLYQRYLLPQTGREAILLPSTSPANCRIPMEKLIEAYTALRE